MKPRTLVDLLDAASCRADTGIRVLDRRGTAAFHSWSDLRTDALAVAGGLAAAGVSRGDRVGIVFPTGRAFLVPFFGCLVAGAVPVPLYPPAHLGRMEEYIARTAAMVSAVDASLVLADPRARRVFGEVLAQAKPRLGCLAIDDLTSAEVSRAKVGPEDIGLIQFSSGTTASPKPVALSHRALLAQAQLLNSFWPDTADVRHSGVSWLPLYHDMGLVGMIFTALERPGVMTLVPPEVFVARPASWLRAISDYRATISSAPTFGYGHCLNHVRDEELEGLDLSSWRVALCGGETVVPEVLRKFAQRFGRHGLRQEALTPVYGLAEASLAVTFSDLSRPFAAARFDRHSLSPAQRAVTDEAGVELASLGRPVPGFEIRIVGKQATTVSDGEIGRVECRGPSLMEGYYLQPDATAAVVHGGWLDTGDYGFIHEGELYLAGRAKDVLIVRGRNHPPDEVEQAAASVPGARPGRAVAATWRPDSAGAEELLVLVEARASVRRETFPTIAEACKAAVVGATGLVPDRVVVLEAGTLPRTSSGKLRRAEAVAGYKAGRLSAPARVTWWRLVQYVARSWSAARTWHRSVTAARVSPAPGRPLSSRRYGPPGTE